MCHPLAASLIIKWISSFFLFISFFIDLKLFEFENHRFEKKIYCREDYMTRGFACLHRLFPKSTKKLERNFTNIMIARHDNGYLNISFRKNR